MLFKELAIGELFSFEAPPEYMEFEIDGPKKSLCRKTSVRKYRYVHKPDFPECQVFTINVHVYRRVGK